mgnify:CR=1 FL=1
MSYRVIKNAGEPSAPLHSPDHPDFPPGPYPIIFIRGFALGEDAIEATTGTPFMGFNLGATKDRQLWTGQVVRLHFPSPLVRLMEDHHYRAIDIDPPADVGQPQHPSPSLARRPPLNPRSIIIHRYYDQVDPHFVHSDSLGSGADTTPPTILDAAWDLKALIDRLKAHYRTDPSAWDALNVPFGVHLVAHSMGGLIARALLQHPELKHSLAAQAINKVFTYATPHGGVALGGFEVPRFLRLQHIHHFHQDHLAQLFNAPTADDLNNDFPTHRFFSLIGTNHRDYGAGWGMARRLAGPMSDGLVQIRRAAVKHTPRAHVHRTHGGPFGIVNSEAGFENLVRFLFARWRLDAQLELHALPLPPALQRAKDQGHRIDAAYWIEASLAPRAQPQVGQRAPVYLTERRKANHSAIFRSYNELLHPERVTAADPHHPSHPRPRHPVLLSVFIDPRHSADYTDLVLSLALTVSATDYAIDGEIHPEHSLADQTLYQDTLKLTFSPKPPPDTNDAALDATEASAGEVNPTRWALTVASIGQPETDPEPVGESSLDTQPTTSDAHASTSVPHQAFAIPLMRRADNSNRTQRPRESTRRDFQATLKLQLTPRAGGA